MLVSLVCLDISIFQINIERKEKGKLPSVSTIMTRIVGQKFGRRRLQRLDEIPADPSFLLRNQEEDKRRLYWQDEK